MMHTPGPWYLKYDAMVFAGNRSIASCGGYSSSVNSTEIREANNANAALIAAAPELLEVCEAALEHLDHADMSYANGIVCNGIDEGALRRAGIEDADVFVALTQGDNRNITATQIAKHVFNVPRAICRVYDPLRQELFNTLGIETISPTTIFAQIVNDKIENPEDK